VDKRRKWVKQMRKGKKEKVKDKKVNGQGRKKGKERGYHGPMRGISHRQIGRIFADFSLPTISADFY